MSGLVESAAAILSASERRLEVAAQNVANIATPGFKRQLSFSRLVAPAEANGASEAGVAVHRDFAQGTLAGTGNPLDLAISGPGFFELRSESGTIYSRQGQFRLAADGTLVTPQGYVLQAAGGGDLVLERAAVSILEDGTVLDRGVPVARIAVLAAADEGALQPVGGSHFIAPEGAMTALPEAVVRQGMVENSNVSLGDEMVSTMAAVRQAETGARLIQVYDELLGRAISSLGQGGR
jgi:flagellar basal-body rod protein FlgF